ncbi:histidine kinase [Nonomuraea sp. NPDC048916]|uniref:sensor histidine kinase n=1 Tax=Nonomuraea sp. NPDC048916 TaxID=3154232 RepID=UPI003407B59A
MCQLIHGSQRRRIAPAWILKRSSVAALKIHAQNAVAGPGSVLKWSYDVLSPCSYADESPVSLNVVVIPSDLKVCPVSHMLIRFESEWREIGLASEGGPRVADDEVGPAPFRQRGGAAVGWASRAKPWSAPERAAPRLAASVLAAWSLGYLLITAIGVFSGEHGEPSASWFPIAVFAVVTLVFLQQSAHTAMSPRTWPRQVRVLTVVVQASTTYLPSVWISPQFLSLIPLLAAACLLVLPGLIGKGLFLVVSATLPLGHWIHDVETPGFLHDIGFALLTGLVVYGLSSLGSVARSVHALRARAAQRAVQRQRLQMAQDIHDLIGHDLLVLKLECELAHRLLPASPHRVGEVLGNALYRASRARADVQSVARGQWRLSLAAELDSMASVLAPADIEVDVAASAGELPPEVDAVLAIALREAMTNLLRHSLAQRCRVRVVAEHGEEGGTVVRLVVANDGAVTGMTASRVKGQGLRNLATRLCRVGGRLHFELRDGWFVFTAEVPLNGGAARASRIRAGFGETRPWDLWRDRSWRFDLAGGWDPRTVVVLLASVLLSHSVVSLARGLALEPPGPVAAAMVGCVVVVFALQAAHSFGRPQRWPMYARIVSLSVQGAATFVPLVWLSGPWGGMAGLFESSLLLLMTGWWRWALYAGVGVALAALAWNDPAEPLSVLPVSSLLVGLAIYGLTRLAGLVGDAYAARARLARTAVDLERLQLAKTLHSLVERYLSAIITRLEQARELLPDRISGARHEMGLALDGARKVITDVREMAGAHHHLSLHAELSSSESVLRAFGIEVETRLAVSDVTGRQGTVLAIALREVVVVLSHRDPRRCVIEVSEDGDALRLRVLDDGDAMPRHSPPADRRLTDLRAVLEGVGGRLISDVEGGWFRLTAEIPAVRGGSGRPPELDAYHHK